MLRFQSYFKPLCLDRGRWSKLNGLFYTTAYGSLHAQHDDGWCFCGDISARLLRVLYRLDLRFLLVLRRAYDDARHIPYTSHTFSSNGISMLTGFPEHLPCSATGHHLAMVGIREGRRRYSNVYAISPACGTLVSISIGIVVSGCYTPADPLRSATTKLRIRAP